MNYGDPTLREHLAAEYVLGTLRGRARRRFERLLAEDAGLRDLVRQWEARLNPLAEQAPAVAPPPQLWTRIEARLGAPASRAPAARRSWIERLFGKPLTPVPSFATAGLWYCVGFWRALGIGGAAVAAALALYLTVGQAPFVPSHVAVLAGEDAKPVLLAQLDAASGRLELRAVGLPAVAPDKSLELWLVPPAGGGAVRSLGLVDPQGYERDLPPADVTELTQGALAVSLEPAGGSPTGVATGPVIYLGPILPAS